MLKTLAVVLAAASGAAILPGAAAASKIVYTCAQDLCVVDPASGVSAPVTSDGAAAPYRYPSVSRDGRLLAAARGDDVVVGAFGAALATRVASSRDINDVSLSPDGSIVGESHSYVENRFGCPLTGGCLELVDRSATTSTPVATPGATNEHPGGGGVGFLGNGALLSSRYILSVDQHQICVFADPTAPEAPCVVPVASAATLSAPAGSPDSRLIAIGVGSPAPSQAVAVGLYDATTGAPVRRLAADGSDPAFSPDGTQVAFTASDGWINVVPTAGGAARRLVQGVSPTWGDGDAPGPGVVSTALRLRHGRIAVRLRCGGPAACRGTVRIRKGSGVLGRRAYRVAAGRRSTVSVRPTSAGRRRIARSRSLAVRVELRPASGQKLARRVTLRR